MPPMGNGPIFKMVHESFGHVQDEMTKCDACVDRVVKGEPPVCVAACPQRALDFGDVDGLKAKYGEGAHIEPLPSPAMTKPNLLVTHGKSAKVVK